MIFPRLMSSNNHFSKNDTIIKFSSQRFTSDSTPVDCYNLRGMQWWHMTHTVWTAVLTEHGRYVPEAMLTWKRCISNTTAYLFSCLERCHFTLSKKMYNVFAVHSSLEWWEDLIWNQKKRAEWKLNANLCFFLSLPHWFKTSRINVIRDRFTLSSKCMEFPHLWWFHHLQ